MLKLNITLDGDGAYPDLAETMASGQVIHLGNDAPPIGITALADGMASGRLSVMLRLDLPDGRVVLAETSLRLFLAAADALRARYGNQL